MVRAQRASWATVEVRCAHESPKYLQPGVTNNVSPLTAPHHLDLADHLNGVYLRGDIGCATNQQRHRNL